MNTLLNKRWVQISGAVTGGLAILIVGAIGYFFVAGKYHERQATEAVKERLGYDDRPGRESWSCKDSGWVTTDDDQFDSRVGEFIPTGTTWYDCTERVGGDDYCIALVDGKALIPDWMFNYGGFHGTCDELL